MNKRSLQIFVLTAAAAALALAQTPAPAPGQAAPAAPAKTAKSQAEADALKAVTTAASSGKPDDVISKAKEFIEKFPDSDFKATVHYEAAQAYDLQRKYDQAVSEGDLAVQADPKNFQALTLVAGELAQHTPTNDLTRAQKLAKADQYAKQALAAIPAATKPNEKMSDADWDSAKALATAGVHYDMGLIAMARRQPAQAATEYKLAVDAVGTPDPIWLVRLGDADLNAGKNDDAIAAFDKVIANKDALPQVKQVAENEKAMAEKNAKKK